jgi:hypothetical protein
MAEVNLRKFVSEHYKSGVTAHDVLREAITNSIHANAKKIDIKLIYTSKPQATYIEEIFITDNGDGFTKDNLGYFNEICTTHKDKIGGKGVGRLSFLKFAHDVHIKSYTKDNEDIEFNYTYDFNLESITPKQINTGIIGTKDKSKTTISISNIIKPINIKIDKLIEDLYDDLQLILFLENQKNVAIDLNFTAEKTHEPNLKGIDKENKSFKGGDIKILSENSFILNNEQFNCYLFKKNYPAKGITATFCANQVGIEKTIISKNFDACKYSVFITSEYLDRSATIERKSLAIPEDGIQDLILNSIISPQIEINKKQLLIKTHNHCMAMVEKIAQTEIKKFQEKNLEKLKTYYPYINLKSLGTNTKLLDTKEMVKAYREQQKNKEDELIDKIKNKTPLKEIFADVSHLASDDLARYICHRSMVIDSLSNMPADKKEEEIHNAFIPKNSKGTNLYENNLWLLDDKFLSYSSVHSDENLTNIIKQVDIDFVSEDNQLERPDVAIFFAKDNNNNPNKLVIIEFKKFLADKYDKGKGLQQCRNYSNELVKKLPSVLEVFAFALVEIDDKFYEELKITKYKDIFSTSERILYNDFEIGKKYNIPMHQYVMPISALLTDAKSRNKLFEDILKRENF